MSSSFWHVNVNVEPTPVKWRRGPHGYKWVLMNLVLGVSLRWTSIPSSLRIQPPLIRSLRVSHAVAGANKKRPLYLQATFQPGEVQIFLVANLCYVKREKLQSDGSPRSYADYLFKPSGILSCQTQSDLMGFESFVLNQI